MTRGASSLDIPDGAATSGSESPNPIADHAPALYQAITAPKALVRFTRAEEADLRTDTLARTLDAPRSARPAGPARTLSRRDMLAVLGGTLPAG